MAISKAEIEKRAVERARAYMHGKFPLPVSAVADFALESVRAVLQDVLDNASGLPDGSDVTDLVESKLRDLE